MKKILYISLASIVGLIVLIFAWLWQQSQLSYPVSYGISYSPEYASSLGLDWKKTYIAILDELNPVYVRVAAPWKKIETEPGVFTFDETDFLMEEARKRGVYVTLVVGQKVPRWPECHLPNWLTQTATDQQVMDYVAAVVSRYGEHESLSMWQLENEPFIYFDFGECQYLNHAVFDKEMAFIQSSTPDIPILLTDSGELGLWKKAIDRSDIFGTTLYRITRSPKGRIVSYGVIPPAFYRYKANILGADIEQFIVAELQAEPWFATGTASSTSIKEQEETMDPQRLKEHFSYVEHIGVSRAYLWGAEWWYFMKEKRNDDRYWNLVANKLMTPVVDE